VTTPRRIRRGKPHVRLVMMEERTDVWTETDSRGFLDLAAIAVPAREEQTEALLALIPAHKHDGFALVDICAGEGVLCERVLQEYPESRVLALDGSPLMRERAGARLTRFGDRAEVRAFDLGGDGWTEDLPSPLRCAVSSMALHHLEAGPKRQLFQRLAERLEPGGALLIADIIAAPNEFARRSFAGEWTSLAREQSLAATGSLDGYERAIADGWHPTWLTEPEASEMPYRVFEQLKWLEEAGFSAVDCFWMRAGHAIYGGYG
jgi:tRNA (cmo5U34)-methyltransferase